MLKAPIRSSVIVAGLVAVLVLDLVVGGVLGAVLGTTLLANRTATPSASAQRTSTVPLLTSVTIPQGQELFKPFILAVQSNTTVTWQNQDTVAHTITTTPDQTPFLNLHAFSLTVAAGQRVQFKLVQPGLYHYYDPALATWNTADARVVAQLRHRSPLRGSGPWLVSHERPVANGDQPDGYWREPHCRNG